MQEQVTAFLLGICFLQQRDPKLIFIFRVDRHQPIVDSWQVVIDDNIHPLSKSPELSKEEESSERKLTTGLNVLRTLCC